jgi:peptidyl-prolyl cis-trans isomerase D
VSFVIWGVGDMLRGFSSNTVAKIGSTTISAQQYQNELQSELYRLQRQLRQSLTPSQARAFGLDAQVLDRLIDQAVVNERARAQGLAISDEAIAELVRKEPSLRDSNGNFDRAKFDSVLREQGLNERAFIADQRDLYLRQQVQYSLVDGLTPPKALVDALQATRSQTREIAYFILGASAAGDIPPPSEETLKAYYKDHVTVWRAPELRNFDALIVTPATLAKPQDVSDDEAKAQYDKDRDAKYTVPEKRKLQQMVFPTEAEAEEAAAKIKAGTSFADFAKASGRSDADIDLGETTKAGMIDPAIAEAAFALPPDGVSAPIKGAFGYVLAHVVAITPGEVKPFDAVKDAVKLAIAAGRASDQVQALHDKIEDAKASGKTVAEAARSVGLEAKPYSGVDHRGRNAQGADAGVPDADVLLPAVFASDVGVDDEALNTKDHGYIWFAVTRIDPAHDRSYDEVMNGVAEAWRVEEIGKRLADAAAEDVKTLNGGGDIAALAKAAGAEVKTAKDIKRAGGGDLSPDVVAAVFGVAPDRAGSARTADDGRIVFKVTADVFPEVAAGDPEAATVETQLKTEIGNAVVEQYVNALKREIGVTIDQRVLQGAEGG